MRLRRVAAAAIDRAGRAGVVVLAATLSGAVLATALPAAPAGAQDGGGISVEEYLRVFPPAPANLRAALESDAVVLSWSAPAPATTQKGLAYDPAIAGYRVYRIDDAGGRTLIGEVGAETTRFRDASARTGVRQYAVTTVQRSGHESGLSAAAEVRDP